MVKFLTEKDLNQIDTGNLVPFVLGGIDTIERDISLNQLAEHVALLTSGQTDLRIHVNNLLNLLHKIVTTQPFDPLFGKIIIEAEDLLPLLIALQKSLNTESEIRWILREGKQTTVSAVDQRLQKIIRHLEFWKKIVLERITLPLGNAHVRDLYHPTFVTTRMVLPDGLPPDYRSNFFFEVKIKELCVYTTCFTRHPYNQLQIEFQTQRPLQKLFFTDVNVDLLNPEEIEAVDNIRAVRLHGPRDDIQYPGSYLFIFAGHHRTRELFQKYLSGEISGDAHLLVQKIDVSEINQSLLKDVYKEIPAREKVRADLWSSFVKSK